MQSNGKNGREKHRIGVSYIYSRTYLRGRGELSLFHFDRYLSTQARDVDSSVEREVPRLGDHRCAFFLLDWDDVMDRLTRTRRSMLLPGFPTPGI